MSTVARINGLEIEDETARREIELLKQNGVGGGGLTANMPIIRLAIARPTKMDNSISEINPLIFTVEILSGNLKVGDKLQLCSRKLFTYNKLGLPRRYKLKKFAEYVITENDLSKQFLTISIGTQKELKELLRSPSLNMLYPKYIRIRRPYYDEFGDELSYSNFSNQVQFFAYRNGKNQRISIK